MIDWLAEESARKAPTSEAFSAKLPPTSPLAQRVWRAVARTPTHKVRALSCPGVDGSELVLVSRRNEDVVRLGARRVSVSTLEAAAIGSFRTLGDISHDLGGPITGVVAAIDAMLDPEPPTDSHELLLEAREEMMRMVELVRRRREGVDTRTSTRGTLEVRSIVESALTTLKGELTRANVDVRVEMPSIVGSLDGALIRSCFIALVLNAIETSRRRANTIAVRAASIEGWLELEIEDAGRGMSEEAVANAGSLFHSTRRTGAGTGLAAVRHSLGAMDGFLSLDTEENVGTVSTFSIPLG